jgi:hypothetical protein
MAERVDDFPKQLHSHELWDKLAEEGGVWKLTEEDKATFSSAKSCSASARYYAQQRQLRSKVMEHQGDIYVSFWEPSTEEEERKEARRAKRQVRLVGRAT